jgi:hypothetical protein
MSQVQEKVIVFGIHRAIHLLDYCLDYNIAIPITVLEKFLHIVGQMYEILEQDKKQFRRTISTFLFSVRNETIKSFDNFKLFV